MVCFRRQTGRHQPPDDRPLTRVPYRVGHPLAAWIKPLRGGRSSADMPLFLTPDRCNLLPLEPTYLQAWSGIPARRRRVIEA